jgi:hypothetical protein
VETNALIWWKQADTRPSKRRAFGRAGSMPAISTDLEKVDENPIAVR